MYLFEIYQIIPFIFLVLNTLHDLFLLFFTKQRRLTFLFDLQFLIKIT